ncbi:MAG: hypothetical protein ABGY11_02570 [Candidatus Thioglobus sp.]|jgi:hypothetical protein
MNEDIKIDVQAIEIQELIEFYVEKKLKGSGSWILRGALTETGHPLSNAKTLVNGEIFVEYEKWEET